MRDSADEPQTADWSFVDALEALIPDVRAFAYSLCQDRSLADDLAQTACLKAWTAAHRFRPGAPMKPWLFRILRNEYLQHVRRDWRLQTAEPAVLEESIATGDPLGAIAELSQVAAAVYALPDQQRDALILVLAAGLSYEEAAEVLSCAPGTVKSRVSRARANVLRDVTAGTGTYSARKPISLQMLIDHADRLIGDGNEAA